MKCYLPLLLLATMLIIGTNANAQVSGVFSRLWIPYSTKGLNCKSVTPLHTDRYCLNKDGTYTYNWIEKADCEDTLNTLWIEDDDNQTYIAEDEDCFLVRKESGRYRMWGDTIYFRNKIQLEMELAAKKEIQLKGPGTGLEDVLKPNPNDFWLYNDSTIVSIGDIYNLRPLIRIANKGCIK